MMVFTARGRRRQRARALQLARRDLQPRVHRHAAARLDHGPRDLPRLEREAAAAGRHVALPLRPAPGDDLALGERGDHRLLRRSRAGARRRRRLGGFLGLTGQKMERDRGGAADRAGGRVALHLDRPDDGSQYLYYPKGSLAGFLLDILIRDASDNRRSLDDVMRELYRADLQEGTRLHRHGLVVRRSAGRRAAARSPSSTRSTSTVASRSPGPTSCLCAGLRMASDTLREPRVGVATGQDSSGAIVVHEVQPGSVAEAAGVKVGDQLLALGDIDDHQPELRGRVPLPVREERGRHPVDPGAARCRHPHAARDGQACRSGSRANWTWTRTRAPRR